MTSMIELEAVGVRSKITKARINMMLTMPFFGPLAMKLIPVAREQRAPLSTDGRHLFFNPRLIANWSMSRLIAGIAHEVLHCALGHPWRRGNRDPEDWNIAADHVINLRLQEDGHDIGENWLADKQYTGLAAEIVYSMIQRNKPPQQPPQPESQDEDDGEGDEDDEADGDQGGDDDGLNEDADDDEQQGDGGAPQSEAPGGETRPGDVEDPQPEDDMQTATEAAEELEAEWKLAVAQAASLAQGEGGASMATAVEESKRAKIDWRAELRRKLQEISRSDYTWTRPSVRYLAQGLYLPSLRDERMGTIVVVRDTSGSIGNAELSAFNAEIAAIVAELQPTRTIVIDCDARVAKVWDIEAGDDLPDLAQAYGRGGTSFVPPFAYLEREGIEPRCLVYLTDMYGDFPKDAPPFDVVWCATTREIAPFGETLPLNG